MFRTFDSCWCFLDCDGVLVDFIGGLCDRLGLPINTLFRADRQRPMPFGLDELLQIPKAEADQLISNLDRTFWANLQPYPWAKTLVAILEDIFDDRLILCTSPGSLSDTGAAGEAAAGKEQWIIRHFPQFSGRYVLTNHKRCLADINRYLIDDSERICLEFAVDDGTAILFPQHWNTRYTIYLNNFDKASFLPYDSPAIEQRLIGVVLSGLFPENRFGVIA